MLHTFTRLLKENRAVAMIEFAFATPLLIFMLFAAIELSNYIYMDQKAKNAGYNVLNLLNTQPNLRLHNIQNITETIPYVVLPFHLAKKDYTAVVTVVQQDVALPGSHPKPYVYWQWPEEGAAFSRFKWKGTASSPKQNEVTPAQMNQYSFQPGDQLVAVEVRMAYRPYFNSAFTRSLLNIAGNELTFFGTARPRKGLFALSPYNF